MQEFKLVRPYGTFSPPPQSFLFCDFFHDDLYIWLIALIAAVMLFEWKCRSENKPLLRASILVAFVGVIRVTGTAGIAIALMRTQRFVSGAD
jgi:hypothetical protein